MTPLPPNESQLTDRQRHALFKIQTLLKREFHRAMLTTIYKGTDDKLHVQVVSTCNTNDEQLDMARRTLQAVEKSTTGIIQTLTPSEKRIIR